MPELTVYKTRLRTLLYAVLSLVCFCLGSTALAQKVPQTATGTTVTIDPMEMQKP